jgi:hypothetical protein
MDYWKTVKSVTTPMYVTMMVAALHVFLRLEFVEMELFKRFSESIVKTHHMILVFLTNVFAVDS